MLEFDKKIFNDEIIDIYSSQLSVTTYSFSLKVSTFYRYDG